MDIVPINKNHLGLAEEILGTQLFPNAETPEFLETTEDRQDIRALAYNSVMQQLAQTRLNHPHNALLARQVAIANNIARATSAAYLYREDGNEGSYTYPQELTLTNELNTYMQTVPSSSLLPENAPITDYFSGLYHASCRSIAIRAALQAILIRTSGIGTNPLKTSPLRALIVSRFVDKEHVARSMFGNDTFDHIIGNIFMEKHRDNGWQKPAITVTDIDGAMTIDLRQFDIALLNHSLLYGSDTIRKRLGTSGNLRSIVFGYDLTSHTQDLLSAVRETPRIWGSSIVTRERFIRQCLPGNNLAALDNIYSSARLQEKTPLKETWGKLQPHQVPLDMIANIVGADTQMLFNWLKTEYPYTIHRYEQKTKKTDGYPCFGWKALEAAEGRYRRLDGIPVIYYDRVAEAADDKSDVRRTYSYNVLRRYMGDDKVAPPAATNALTANPILEKDEKPGRVLSDEERRYLLQQARQSSVASIEALTVGDTSVVQSHTKNSRGKNREIVE